MCFRSIATAVVGVALAACEPSTPPTVVDLEAQLAGSHCRFEHEYDGCRRRSLRVMDVLFLRQHSCELWAVRCLGTIGSTDATAALIRVLVAKSDMETCDGVIPVRSTAVSLLGESADTAAVEPLQRLLAARPQMTMSAGAVGCELRREDDRPVRAALDKLGRR